LSDSVAGIDVAHLSADGNARHDDERLVVQD
jgi:hypothetical protein